MSFIEDAFEWVEDEIIEPAAHFVRNIVENPIVPLMIVGGVAVSVLAPEFLPAVLPEIGEAVAASEAVAAAEAADIGIGAAELAADSEVSLLADSGLASQQNLYEAVVNESSAADMSSAIDRISQEQAMNLGEDQRFLNLPSRFNTIEKLIDKSRQALSTYETVKETVKKYDDSYMNKRQKLATSQPAKNPTNNEDEAPKPQNEDEKKQSEDPSWNDPGSTNRQGALHDLGLWRANAPQVNFSTTPIMPRDMDDDPTMVQSGDFIRMRNARYRMLR